MEIARLEDGGAVELIDIREGKPWRMAVEPGADLSGLPAVVRQQVEAFWSEDVGGGLSRKDRHEIMVYTPPPEVDLLAYAALKRWEKEVGGVDTPAGFRVPTDDRAKLLIQGAALFFADEDTSPLIISGFNYGLMTGKDFRTLNMMVVRHVQGTFATMASVLEQVASGEITSTEAVDAAFAG